MRLTMKQRQAVTAVTVQRYRKASKKVKRQILDEFCETTGYCRGYARFVLRNHGPQVWRAGKRVVVGAVSKSQPRQKPRYYDEQVVQELSKLWQMLDYICGKRLVVILPELIAKLEQFGELRLARSTKEKLLRISASSIDRLLQPERRKHQLRRRSRTKPGSSALRAGRRADRKGNPHFMRKETKANMAIVRRQYLLSEVIMDRSENNLSLTSETLR